MWNKIKRMFKKARYFEILYGNTEFLYPFITTILIVVLFNLGIFLQWPNLIGWEWIDFISSTTNNNSLELFIGLITVFILFFTFVQFSFTRDSLPSEIIRTYIVDDPNTFIYLGVQISFALILATFSLFERIIIFHLILGYAIILFSVLLSILYFRWIIQNATTEGMIKIILEDFKLHLRKVDIIEKKLNENLTIFKNGMVRSELKFGIILPIDQVPKPKNSIIIKTSRNGFVKNINLSRLLELLIPYKGGIEEISFYVQIGNYLQTDSNNQYRTLAVITTSPQDHFPTSLIKDIETCFEIDDAIYDKILRIIEYISYFILHSADKETLIKYFVEFMREELEAEHATEDIKIRLKEDLYIEIVQLLVNKIRYESLNNINLTLILGYIYVFRNIAIENRWINLLNEILKLFRVILFKSYDPLVNLSLLSSAILRIQEIAISPIVYKTKEASPVEVGLNWAIFYKPLFNTVLNEAMHIFNMMLDNFHKQHPDDSREIFIENAENLLNLLPLDLWDSFNRTENIDPQTYVRIRKIIISLYALHVIYISILMYKKRRDAKDIPNWLLLEIGFPLSQNCNTFAKYDIKADDILSNFFFDINFNEPDFPFSQYFEISRIHESGAYTPIYYDFKPFWLGLSLYRFMDNGRHVPYNLVSELPITLSAISQFKSYINYVIKADGKFEKELFQIDDAEFDKFKESYLKHLKILLEKLEVKYKTQGQP